MRFSTSLLVLPLLLLLSELGLCSKILMYFPISTPSHKNVFRPLAHALAARGHHVTVITTIRDEFVPENVTEIFVEQRENLLEQAAKEAMNPSFSDALRLFKFLMSLPPRIQSTHEDTLVHPEVKAMLAADSEVTFDLAFVPPLFNEVGYYLARRFNSSLVLLMPSVANNLMTSAMGFFDNPSFVTSSVNERGQAVTPSLFERLVPFVLHNFYDSIKKRLFTRDMESLIQAHVITPKNPRSQTVDRNNDNDEVDLLDLERNAIFGMYFSHYLFDAIRPTLPNTIDIGAIQCRPARPLHPSLEKSIFKTEAPSSSSEAASKLGSNGSRTYKDLALVSFGSWLNLDHLPEAQKASIFSALNRLPMKVVVKHKTEKEKEKESTLAGNVITREWLPQQDILGHESTKIFISQGGMMSVQESLYHGIPLLIIPFFGDQRANAIRAERQGYGKMLEIKDVTESSVLAAVSEVLSDPTYKSRAEEIGRLMRDDIQSPLDRAIYWTEYVIRHQGAAHLNSPARGVSWVHFYHLDIWLLFALPVVVQSWIIWKVTWLVFRKVLRR